MNCNDLINEVKSAVGVIPQLSNDISCVLDNPDKDIEIWIVNELLPKLISGYPAVGVLYKYDYNSELRTRFGIRFDARMTELGYEVLPYKTAYLGNDRWDWWVSVGVRNWGI